MNCPHCSKPIDPALILKARQSELAKRPRPGHERPGAKGLVRNGCAHDAAYVDGALHNICGDCGRMVRWDTKAAKWRVRYDAREKRSTP